MTMTDGSRSISRGCGIIIGYLNYQIINDRSIALLKLLIASYLRQEGSSQQKGGHKSLRQA